MPNSWIMVPLLGIGLATAAVLFRKLPRSGALALALTAVPAAGFALAFTFC